MGRLVMFNLISIDGFFEAIDQNIDWMVVDEEFGRFSTKQLEEASTLIFGRVTYEGMSQYWMSPEASELQPEIAKLMNTLPKVVVSRTMKSADWQNTTVIRDDLESRLIDLKEKPGVYCCCLAVEN